MYNMYKIIPNVPTSDHMYQQWKSFYEPHVQHLFNHLLEKLEDENILYMNYDFETFCNLVYKKSSKRMPVH